MLNIKTTEWKGVIFQEEKVSKYRLKYMYVVLWRNTGLSKITTMYTAFTIETVSWQREAKLEYHYNVQGYKVCSWLTLTQKYEKYSWTDSLSKRTYKIVDHAK